MQAADRLREQQAPLLLGLLLSLLRLPPLLLRLLLSLLRSLRPLPLLCQQAVAMLHLPRQQYRVDHATRRA